MEEASEQKKRVADLFGLPEESSHFEEAITHPSYAHEVADAKDNQRLEFLGDAILDFLISEVLFARFPDSDEGRLTRVRSQLVSTGALARFARHHEIGRALRFGKGAEKGTLHDSDNVLADAVEALLAATYLENGRAAAEKVGTMILDLGMSSVEQVGARDVKSALQEKVQALGKKAPVYEVVEQTGPAHATVFRVQVSVSGRVLSEGSGRSKRLAERAAAEKALEGGRYESILSEEPEDG